MAIFEDLNVPILEKIPMSEYTFTKTGGPADYLAFPENNQQVAALIQRAHELKMPVTIVGNASNMIIRDGGVEGLVILLTRIEDIEQNDNQLIVSAGTPLMTVSEAAYQFGLTGLEFAAGIPGSVGGAVYMNAGAYGGEVSNVITEIDVLDEVGELHVLRGAEMRFGYRHSVVQEANLTVVSATFELKPGDPEKIRKTMDAYNQARASKQPLDLPSCGSVFERPKGYYTGPLIQQAGLQGHIIGGAQISMKHAGFIVNIDHATATDYLDMIALIQKTIKEKFGVALRPEVRIIGRE